MSINDVPRVSGNYNIYLAVLARQWYLSCQLLPSIMGQCWTKQRKKAKSGIQSKYLPSTSESRQPMVNGGISTTLSAGVSQLSIDKHTQHISERENAGEHVFVVK